MVRWLRSERERASRRHTLSRADRRLVWAACARLLDYPTEELLADLDGIEAPLPAGVDLAPLLAHLRGTDLLSLQQQYVATFDHTRRCALYLTYFAYGDTRRRGVALVQFKQAYRKGGAEFDESSGDLPDHLCAVLQFGAEVDPDGAWDLLLDHRAGVEMLRIALADWDDGAGSPWLPAVAGVCETLPPLRGDEAEAVRRLIEEGPPAEEVGLEGYSMAAPQPSQPQFVGMPSGGRP